MSLETDVGVFIDGVLNYFSTSVQQGAQCGTPHLALSDKPELADYTGVIQVSGKRTGLVAFTAPLARALLGKHAGDLVTVRTPRGNEELEIISIDYES